MGGGGGRVENGMEWERGKGKHCHITDINEVSYLVLHPWPEIGANFQTDFLNIANFQYIIHSEP